MNDTPSFDVHIATIRSLIHERHEGALIIPGEGFYELEVFVNLMESKGDAKGFVAQAISSHLIKCFIATKIPLGEGIWFCQFTPFAQDELGYPEHHFF